uniref:Microfibrillar associated protein 5 n=1 Tax=Callorhinchus milii TaxID=7868 RepID=V9LIT8_CALMI
MFWNLLCLLLLGFSSVTDAQIPTPDQPDDETLTQISDNNINDCRVEQFLCTRLYSVYQPRRFCIHSTCITNLRRIYVLNKEICSRTICAEDEGLRAEICRQKTGRRYRRSNENIQRREIECEREREIECETERRGRERE